MNNVAPRPTRNVRLLDQVRLAVRRRHYSYRTEQAYIHWIRSLHPVSQPAPPTRYGRT